MNFAKGIVSAATAPARVGLAAADASLNLASAAVGVAKRALGDGPAGTNALTSMLGIDDALVRANRLAKLLDDNAPLGRAVAPDGPLDRLLRPGGVVGLLTSEGGLLDRLTAEGGGLHRALHALCAYIAADPVFARLGFIEVFAPGPDGMLCRERLIAQVAESFRASAPAAQRPSELASEASVGAIWGIVHRYIASGQAHRLARITPVLSFLALAPAIGSERAVRAIAAEHERMRREGGSPARYHVRALRNRGSSA